MAARFHALITDFCYGETSPRVKSRVAGGNIFGLSPADVNRSGCKDLTNVIVLPQGGAYRREGFRYNRDTTRDVPGSPSTPINYLSYRIFPLRGAAGDSVLLFVPGEVWMYEVNNFSVLGHAATPYGAADLADLGIAQYGQRAVVYSLGHRPRQIKFSGGAFTFTDPGSTYIAPLYAYQDAKSPPQQINTWRLRITFLSGYTGSYVKATVSGHKGNVDVLVTTTTGATATALQTYLTSFAPIITGVVVTFVTSGTAAGNPYTDYDVKFQYASKYGDGTISFVSTDGGCLPVTTKTTSAVGDLEPLWSGPLLLLKSAVYYECIAAHTAAAGNEPGVGAGAGAFWINRGATLLVDRDYDVVTDAWALDNTYAPRGRGWPGHMTFHEQRLVGDGPAEALNVIAGAKLGGNDDMFNFTLGVNENDGLLFRLAGAESASVRWLHSADRLYIGTSAGVFVQMATPWTATNAYFPRVNGYGCAVHVHAVEIDGEVFFPTVGARQVRQLAYSNELQSWESFDLTAFAEHLFTRKKRIKQLASHQGVDNILWAVRTDGALLGLTYSPAYHTLGWHKHNVGDPVIEVCPVFNGIDYVTVALVARRLFNIASGVWETRPCFETLPNTSQNLFDIEPEFFDEAASPNARPGFASVDADPEQWSVHLESCEKLKSPGDPTLAVPERFVNRTIGLVENGVYLGSFDVDSSVSVEVPTIEGATLWVGFEVEGRIVPNRFEAPTGAGTLQSQKIRWVQPVMRLLSSAMPLLNGYRANERTQEALYDEATGLTTGDVKMFNLGSDGEIGIDADLPLPFHLTGLFGLMTTEEG